MSNKEAAERACKEPNPIIDGRKANVNLAILGAKPRGNLTGNLERGKCNKTRVSFRHTHIAKKYPLANCERRKKTRWMSFYVLPLK